MVRLYGWRNPRAQLDSERQGAACNMQQSMRVSWPLPGRARAYQLQCGQGKETTARISLGEHPRRSRCTLLRLFGAQPRR